MTSTLHQPDKCVQCGVVISPDSDTCPNCGHLCTHSAQSIPENDGPIVDQASPCVESSVTQELTIGAKWKKILRLLLILVPLLGLLISFAGNVVQYISYKANLQQYLEQQVPELDCQYQYLSAEDTLGFNIRNVGLVDAASVWATESIFMIIGGQVYEGTDVPRFHYLVYNDSREKMWDIPKDDTQPLELPKTQPIAFQSLMKRFQTDIVSKWTISFSRSTSSKRYSIDEYFLHKLSNKMPQILSSVTAGPSVRNRITDYLASGPTHEIRIFDLTNDFELDTPINYRIAKDYSIHPLYPSTRLSIEEYNNTRLWFGLCEPQVADDVKGSLRHAWQHKNGKWLKWITAKGEGRGSYWTTSDIILPRGYLHPDDAERVERDPTLLKAHTNDPAIKQDIRHKARDKFLKMRPR